MSFLHPGISLILYTPLSLLPDSFMTGLFFMLFYLLPFFQELFLFTLCLLYGHVFFTFSDYINFTHTPFVLRASGPFFLWNFFLLYLTSYNIDNLNVILLK